MRKTAHASFAASLMLCALGASAAPAQQPQPPSQPQPQPPSAGGTPDKVPFDVPYGLPISLDEAELVVEAAKAEAKKRGWPMNIAVVDSHGDLVSFARMDGAQLVSIGVSQRKARTAARWRRETRVFFNGAAAAPNIYGTLDPDLAASPGGLPIIDDNRVIGAVGCSGGTGDQDVVVCQAGLDALKEPAAPPAAPPAPPPPARPKP